MINSRFREGIQKQIRLPEDDPYAFKIYLSWLYTRRLPAMGEDESEQMRQETDLKAFVLGDIPTFKQMNYRRLLAGFRGCYWPPVDFMELLYSYQAVTAKIQKYLVYYFASATLENDLDRTDKEWLMEVGRRVPEFALDVVGALFDGCIRRPGYPQDNSEYEFCDPPRPIVQHGGKKRTSVSETSEIYVKLLWTVTIILIFSRCLRVVGTCSPRHHRSL